MGNLGFQAMFQSRLKHGDRSELANVLPTRSDRRALDVGRERKFEVEATIGLLASC